MVELGSTEITRETGHTWAANSSTNSRSQVTWTGRWSHFLSQWGEPGRGWEEWRRGHFYPMPLKEEGSREGWGRHGEKGTRKKWQHGEPRGSFQQDHSFCKATTSKFLQTQKACLDPPPPPPQIIRETILSDTYSISAVPWITELYRFSWHFLSWVTQAIVKLT